MNVNVPFIPETITVHLGPPDSDAENVTIPFVDYIANVASSEIYPTWPENAIRANMYAQISFVLNRIYTEYYRSRGYDFDITNSTAFDQSFVKSRDIFENINRIAGELFNNYIVRQGNVEPLFAQYCDGIEVSCNGLSQWGSVTLAEEGRTPYEILTYYYGDNINLVTDAPIDAPDSSAPEVPLRLGSVGDDVRTLQIRLNRISNNYPAIQKIITPDGFFSDDTERAVKDFQNIFGLEADGVVGKSTWYAIRRIYNAVKRLNELDSEGISLSEVTDQFESDISLGDQGNAVANLQLFINYLATYYNTIPSIAVDGIFGSDTQNAVFSVQRTFDLPITGIVDAQTWEAIYRAYLGIIGTVPTEFTEGVALPYSGVPLRIGSEREEVRALQEYLNFISQYYPEIPSVSVTGYFGTQTQRAVRAFQRLFGIAELGTVGLLTWDAITGLYSDLYRGEELREGQYPGYEVGS